MRNKMDFRQTTEALSGHGIGQCHACSVPAGAIYVQPEY